MIDDLKSKLETKILDRYLRKLKNPPLSPGDFLFGSPYSVSARAKCKNRVCTSSLDQLIHACLVGNWKPSRLLVCLYDIVMLPSK